MKDKNEPNSTTQPEEGAEDQITWEEKTNHPIGFRTPTEEFVKDVWAWYRAAIENAKVPMEPITGFRKRNEDKDAEPEEPSDL